MKYTILIIACLMSLAGYSQKKATGKRVPIPPPPRVIEQDREAQDLRNPFADDISFSWKNLPETPTVLTSKDLFEKTYTFSNYGKNVRLSM